MELSVNIPVNPKKIDKNYDIVITGLPTGGQVARSGGRPEWATPAVEEISDSWAYRIPNSTDSVVQALA